MTRNPSIDRQKTSAARNTVFSVSIVGTLAFLALLALSFVSPVTLEAWARAAVEHEIERRVAATVRSIDEATLIRAAERALDSNNHEIRRATEALAELPALVAGVTDEMLNPECPCRAKARELYRSGLGSRIAALASANERLTQLIQTRYAEVSQALLREFRIFTGANALVFAGLGLVALARPKANVQLVSPSIVLLGAGTLVAYLYLFAQNWPQTILLSDYVGLWYFPYLGIALAFLCDVMFNRARVTTWLVNCALKAVGSAFSVVPC